MSQSIFPDGEYVTLAPDGRYAASANVERLLTLTENGVESPISDAYRSKYLAKDGFSP